MNHYRCTRDAPYDDPNCPGHKDVTARQGHYVNAETEDDARAKMAREFPGETFVIQYLRPAFDWPVKGSP